MFALKKDDTERERADFSRLFANEIEALTVQARLDVRKDVEKAVQRDLEAQVATVQRQAQHRYDEALAQYQHDCEADIEALATRMQKDWRESQIDEWRDRWTTLRDQAAAAETRAQEAEEALLSVILALFPDVKTRYAIGRHVTMLRLDISTVNAALQRSGWRLVPEAGDTAFPVTVDGPQGPKLYAAVRRLALGSADEAPESADEATSL